MSVEYGKLENDVIYCAPDVVEYNGETIFNPSNEILEALGYKKIIEEEKPVVGEFQYLASKNIETDVITISYELRFIDYDEAVNSKIKERYSDSQEFAILRQKDEKPEEYQGYYNYCEECKQYVKNIYNK